ncbi:hypothetical protein HNP48_002023 [Acidovorax soli]|uniref:AAA+ ATPase domain-containing protein n=1 Tax=Acidovorax soli TaxID=592050 RepID=A0A7X0PD60_9BURK|nr:AAA family ATPase [Acidovorax soli]MBB6559356.1 hypothetical protein [Acidovorax soli]
MPSPELTGGAGFTYEDAVAAHYCVAMLMGTTAASLDGKIVQRVSQQQGDFGEPLDDVIVDAASLIDGASMRLSLQVKRSLTISSAASNTDFREVIHRSWTTLQKPDFRENLDRFGAASQSVAEEAIRAFNAVCEWARASDSADTFIARFAEGGSASGAHIAIVKAVRDLVEELVPALSDVQLHRLLAHSVLIRFDFLHEGATHDADAIVSLQRGLATESVDRAAELWDLLRQLARDGAGRNAVHTRASILRALPGWRFGGVPAFERDIQMLRENTRHWLDQQANSIGGTHLARRGLREKLTQQMSAHRLTLIKGLPGTGKTVLLRELLQGLAADGTTLLLTANRLSGRSWLEHARTNGLRATSIEDLLVEVSATGHAVLAIDGIDRIAPEQRAVVTDLLGQLHSNPTLADWRIVATARDAGVEPLRNWVPSALLANAGVGYVDVLNLDDEDADSLSASLPALRPLLTGGNERVRLLARRPFFAAVLARGFSHSSYPSDFAPQSEVDLVDAWWSRGGYDAQLPQALTRQRALIELAQRSASDLGRHIRIRDLSAPTLGELSALEEDGLVQQVRPGHTVQFSHDIFFEWSFLHLMLDRDERWIEALTEAGEPPALARVVELLSQATYVDFDQWQRELHVIEQAQVRPQWLRAWLMAPVFSPRFAEHSDRFEAALGANSHLLLGKLLLWMQAEKTTPNPMVLSGALGEEMDGSARVRLADALGWPSDFAAWRRLLIWILPQVELLPSTLLHDVLTLFETWQTPFMHVRDSMSRKIVEQSASWLHAIEDEHVDRRGRRPGFSATPDQPRPPMALESRLRSLILRSAHAFPDVVTAYLNKIESIERWSDGSFRELMAHSALLAQTHSVLLAQCARRWFMKELPDERSARWEREMREQAERRAAIQAMPPESRSRMDAFALDSPNFPPSFSRHDWERLSIGADHQGFFPASPLREPFHSLLRSDPATGLALIRDITNHATTAWCQMHGHWHGSKTPLPLRLVFPWGIQEFWGDDRRYVWFRGQGGPQVVECAHMALERWGIAQLDVGRDLDEVLQQLFEGQTSLSVVGIAVQLFLRARKISRVTLALIGSIRIWRLDLARSVQEVQLQQAALMGFDSSTDDAPHRQVITESNRSEARRWNVRDLSPFFALNGDVELRDAFRSALEQFPDKLELSYAEDAQDIDYLRELRTTAQLWAEFGRSHNYTTEAVPDSDGMVQIAMSSPRHETQELVEQRERYAQSICGMQLWGWVQKSFEQDQLPQDISVDDAVGIAVQLDEAISSGQTLPGADVGLIEGAIAGTAAVLLCFGDADAHEAWATETIERNIDNQGEIPGGEFSGAIIPWHPSIFVARAVAARIRIRGGHARDRETLYRLIAHPLDVVSLVALEGVISCWDQDPKFAWCGINLGLRLAVLGHRRDSYRLDPATLRQADSSRRTAAVASAWAEYSASGAFVALVRPGPTWQPIEMNLEDAEEEVYREDGSWRRSDELWDSSHAAAALQRVPVEVIMVSEGRAAFVDAIEAYVHWTLDTIDPDWRSGQHFGRVRDEGQIYDWIRHLSRTLARIVPYLSRDISLRLLQPILSQTDETAERLLAPFTSRLVAQEVLDGAETTEETLHLLKAIVQRVLAFEALQRSPLSDGRMGGSELQELVKTLLLVSVENAFGSVRFANGRWDELEKMMPVIEPIVRSAGWHPYVATQFVTLCERAGAAYPVGIFADQILVQIVDGKLPEIWKVTKVPATIAALVQSHADRLHPLPADLATKLLRVLDALVDLGDRRSAALQQSESFRGVRLDVSR